MRKNISSLFLSLVIIISGLEYAIREFGLVNRLHNHCANIRYANIGFLHRGNQQTNFWIEGLKIPYNTNELGFRDKSREPAAPAKRRIVVLGDSFVESPYTPLELTFPYILEKNTGIEMINLGRMGLGTVQELEVYKTFGKLFKPDAIIISFYINDVANNYYPPDSSWPPVEDLNIYHVKPPDYSPVETIAMPKFSPIAEWLNERFYLYQFICDLIQKFKNRLSGKTKGGLQAPTGIESKLFLDPEPREVTLAWKITADTLAKFKAFGLPVEVVYIPPVYNLNPVNKVSAKLEAICKDNGFKFLNLPERGMKREYYYKKNMHLNIGGQFFVAHCILTHDAQFLYNEKIASHSRTTGDYAK